MMHFWLWKPFTGRLFHLGMGWRYISFDKIHHTNAHGIIILLCCSTLDNNCFPSKVHWKTQFPKQFWRLHKELVKNKELHNVLTTYPLSAHSLLLVIIHPVELEKLFWFIWKQLQCLYVLKARACFWYSAVDLHFK